MSAVTKAEAAASAPYLALNDSAQGIRTPRATIRCRLYDVISKGHWVDWNGTWATDSYAVWRYPQPITTPDLAGAGIEPGRYHVTAKGLGEPIGSDRLDVDSLLRKFPPLATMPVRWVGIAYAAPSMQWRRLYDGSAEWTSQALDESPDPGYVLDVWRGEQGGDRYTSVAYRPLIMRESQYSARTVWADPDKDVHPLVVRDHRDEVSAMVMPVRTNERTILVAEAPERKEVQT